MSAQDFLVELGTEELPPKALNGLAEAFLAGIQSGLESLGLEYAAARCYATPRRLAVLVERLAVQQPDRQVTLDGPPLQAAFDSQGTPTPAALGFARKCGVDLAALDRSGPKLRYSRRVPGQPTSQLLPGLVEAALQNLPIPKRMRWGERREEFVRPTQWLVMLFGDQVIDCEILAQPAGRESRGHRFHQPGEVRISAPANYAEDLRGAWVIADFAERRALIASRVTALAAQQHGRALMPDELLDEVTGLVEWPVPLVCAFEERFLEVPQQALISTMQDNQKYFCLLDAQGKLLPRFITVANIESKDPAQIVAGNEKVVRPRLTDAEFFFKQDKKHPLESFNERLSNVVFQAQLGSVLDKARRVSELAAWIADHIGGNTAWAARAGLLSKSDLATQMVGEFPELQGIAGRYYALAAGEPAEVALALDEQYMPRGAGGQLPSTLTGAALAVADRLDTLVGIFGIGMPPTGSKDPYALRRAALGILRILIDRQLDLDLVQATAFAVGLYGNRIDSQGVAEQVLEFIFDRLRARYEDEGIDTACYLAVRAVRPGSALDFHQRVQAVQHFRRLPQAAALAAANKRVSNLLATYDPDKLPAGVQAHYFDSPSEFALYAALQQADHAVRPLAEARQYSAALERLAALREPVDAFFDAVLVNAEDESVRANRYALLAQLRALFLVVADISLLG